MSEYKIEVEGTWCDLALAVNTMTKEGWKPLGGVAVVRESGDCIEPFWFFQAMIRHENQAAEPDIHGWPQLLDTVAQSMCSRCDPGGILRALLLRRYEKEMR